MQFKPLVFASLLTFAYASSVQDILGGLGLVSTALTTLESVIGAFPLTGGGLLQGLAIHTEALATKAAIDATTLDAANVDLPVSVDDAEEILAAVQNLQPLINSTLSGIVAKKTALDNLPLGSVSGLVKQDLNNLNISNEALETALLASTPPEVLQAAEQTKAKTDAVFAAALAAFS